MYTDVRTTVQPFIESYFKVALSSFGEATEVGVIEMQMAIEDAGREKRWMADGGWKNHGEYVWIDVLFPLVG